MQPLQMSNGPVMTASMVRERGSTQTKQQWNETVCCIRRLYRQDNVSTSTLRQRAVFFGHKAPDVDSRD